MNRVARISVKTVSGALALFSAYATVSAAIGSETGPGKLTQDPALRDSIRAASKKSSAQDRTYLKVRNGRSPASVSETRAGPVMLKANTGPSASEATTSPAKALYRTSK